MPENRRAERGAEIEELPAALLNQSVAMPADQAHRREAQAGDVRNDACVALPQSQSL
jgi:hypothetical protein